MFYQKVVSHFEFRLPVLYPEAVPDFGELVVEVEVDAELMRALGLMQQPDDKGLRSL